MLELPLFNKDGKSAGTVQVDETLFGDKVKKRLLHQVIVAHEANQRQGNASTKQVKDVEGSTRKPWPQKHTGMARQGMTRMGHWRKGGVTHGPQPRDYRQGVTSSMRRSALNSAILGKLRDKEIAVIEVLAGEKAKTKHYAGLIKTLGFPRSLLIGTKDPKSTETKNGYLGTRNLGQHVTVMPVAQFNAYHVLRHKNILLTKEALDALVASRKGKS
jgi:large subunit ribosomal protein L4